MVNCCSDMLAKDKMQQQDDATGRGVRAFVTYISLGWGHVARSDPWLNEFATPHMSACDDNHDAYVSLPKVLSYVSDILSSRRSILGRTICR